MDQSVFYPGPPVFRGANYLDALADNEARALLDEVGEHGAIDFFCLMLQIHEHVHRVQTGEPLLNEVVQAALWSCFLEGESLLRYQRGPSGSLIREMPVIERHPGLVSAAVTAGLDTARMVDRMAGPSAYDACCLLANRFDAGQLRYADYLRCVTDALAVQV